MAILHKALQCVYHCLCCFVTPMVQVRLASLISAILYPDVRQCYLCTLSTNYLERNFNVGFSILKFYSIENYIRATGLPVPSITKMSACCPTKRRHTLLLTWPGQTLPTPCGSDLFLLTTDISLGDTNVPLCSVC